MSTTRMLEGKATVIFRANGLEPTAPGAVIAKESAAEGSQAFLAGRTEGSLEAVAAQIRGSGGRAKTSVVDVLDDAAVKQCG